MRLLNHMSEWWSRLLHQKFLRHTTFNSCNPRPTDSTLWKALLKITFVILDNQRRVIGDGGSVRALEDEWVPGLGTLRRHFLPRADVSTNVGSTSQHPLPYSIDDPTLLVANLISQTDIAPHWNEPLLRSL